MININILKNIKEGKNPTFRKDKDVIGSSEISFCGRNLIIKKIYGYEFQGNGKTLFGQIFEDAIYEPITLRKIIMDIYKETGIIPSRESITPQAEGMFEVLPGLFLRMHPDVDTDQYCIEVKTTFMFKRDKNNVQGWDSKMADIKTNGQNSELIAHYINQLNTCICYFKRPRGYLYYFNANAFTSGIKEGINYWDKLSKGYEIMLEVQPDFTMYNLALEKIKIMFGGIETHDWSMFEDCIFSWECKHCDPRVRKKCGKEEYKCTYVRHSGYKCNKELYDYPEKLTEIFMNEPICENHYKLKYPRRDYSKYKFKK